MERKNAWKTYSEEDISKLNAISAEYVKFLDNGKLKSFSRLSIKVSLEGGNVMNYRIEEKPAMLLTGYKRRFCGNPNDRKAQDHYFACETRALQYMRWCPEPDPRPVR